MTAPDSDRPFDELPLDARRRWIDETLRHPVFVDNLPMRVLFEIEHDDSVEASERFLAGQDYARHRSQLLVAFQRFARVTGKYDGLANFLAMLAEHDRLP